MVVRKGNLTDLPRMFYKPDALPVLSPNHRVSAIVQSVYRKPIKWPIGRLHVAIAFS